MAAVALAGRAEVHGAVARTDAVCGHRGEFTVGDLRVAIQQRLGTLHRLVARAIAILETNHLVEDDAHPGELLLAVLVVDETYWREHVAESRAVNLIADQVMQECEYIREPLAAFKFDTFE